MPSPDEMRQTPGEFQIVEYHVRDFEGDHRQMDHGDPNCERMVLLREEFALDEVVAVGGDEWEQMLALKRWVRSRWNHGWSACWGEVKDALDVLRFAETGEQFTCGFYGQVFSECCTALGWPARGIGIGLANGAYPRDYTFWNVGHALPEVWSNDFGKWVIMDPDLNAHYEWEGEPLGALEIHEAWMSGVAGEVDVVYDEPRFVMPTGAAIEQLKVATGDATWTEERIARTLERFGRHDAMDYYARLRIAGWNWLDERCPPSFIYHFAPAGAQKLTANRADMYWTVNLVRPVMAASWDESGARLQVTCDHCMPWFGHFEVARDGEDWQRCDEAFVWAMREGLNVLEMRGVNVRGRVGPSARVVVAYAGAQW